MNWLIGIGAAVVLNEIGKSCGFIYEGIGLIIFGVIVAIADTQRNWGSKR